MKSTRTLNATQVVSTLSDLYFGPYLFPREVEIAEKDGQAVSLHGNLHIPGDHPLMNNSDVSEEVLIVAARQFSTLLQRQINPGYEPRMEYTRCVKIIDVKKLGNTFQINVVKESTASESLLFSVDISNKIGTFMQIDFSNKS